MLISIYHLEPPEGLMSETLGKRVTRRQFLKWGAATGAVVAGFPFTACSTGPIVIEPLPNYKVQPPKNGCLTGIGQPSFIGTWASESLNEVTEVLGDLVRQHYGVNLGKTPAVINFQYNIGMYDILFNLSRAAAKNGVIPVQQVGAKLELVVSGSLDDVIQKAAQESVRYGEEHGGFFLSPFWEMNLSKKVWPWAGRSVLFKDAWKHLWEIFESEGANKYATWTPAYHTDGSLVGYWPGDKYVDWIGFSAYDRRVLDDFFGHRSLHTLIARAYRTFAKKKKPYIIEEMGTSRTSHQPEWLRQAISYIKDRPNIKGYLYWDNVNNELRDDHSLSYESISVLNEILKDSYFIGSST